MDKELLRLVIIAIGALVILCMVLWHLFRNKKKRRDKLSFYNRSDTLDSIDPSLVIHTENDDFDIVPLGSAFDDELDDDLAVKMPDDSPTEKSAVPAIEIPKIIQFSLVAVADEGFQGLALQAAFERVGLVFGSMQVFERLDALKQVDFAVASMVEPGIFPIDDMQNFTAPGIVFFMQPYEMDEPCAVFDDLIQTMNALADELDGVMWDHNRQPLTIDTIDQFRAGLLLM
jgi:cell division protein ZipA